METDKLMPDEKSVLREPQEVIIAPNPEALSEAAAGFWVDCAGRTIPRDGRFTVALAGGSTPCQLYELLATTAWRSRVDWSRTHAFWGDERMVPGSDVNSNFTLASSTLLTHVPIPFGQIHRIRTEAGDAAAVAAAYEAELRGFFPPSLGEWPRFDLILLGMGPDGHVASLFPDRPALAESIRWVVASSPGLPPPVTRVTLTLPVLNAAAAVAFLVSGSDKAPALRRALAGDERLPAARVKPVNGTLRWFVDSNAAGHA